MACVVPFISHQLFAYQQGGDVQVLGATQACDGPMRCARYSLVQCSKAGQLSKAPSSPRHRLSLDEEG